MFNVQFNAGASREALRRAIDQLEDMTPIYSDVADYMQEATKARFVQGRSPSGAAWAPKRPATLERYKRLGYGALTRPLLGPTGSLGRDIQKRHGRDYAEVGSSAVYAGVMQDGAAKGAFGVHGGRAVPWGRIPARTWLGLSAEDDRQIVEIVEEHLAADLAAKG